MKDGWRLASFVGLVAAAAFVTNLVVAGLVDDDGGGTCGTATASGGLGATRRAVLGVRPDQDTSLDLGRSTGRGSLDIALEVVQDPEPVDALDGAVLAARPTTFRKVDGPRELGAEDLGNASVRRSGEALTLTWCIERTASSAAPGQYQGAVLVDDPAAEPLVVPVTLTLSDPATGRAAAVLVVVAGAALLMTWNIRASRDPRDFIISREFTAWVFTVEGLASFGAGSAAMATVFWASYMDGQTFGASSWDWAVLVGGLYVAFVGAAATVGVLTVPGRATAGVSKGD